MLLTDEGRETDRRCYKKNDLIRIGICHVVSTKAYLTGGKLRKTDRPLIQ